MARRLPTPAWTVGYQGGWLRGDLVAGVTVTAYLIPQGMAYAEVAGVPPVVGIWASIGALLPCAVLGSSNALSVGPESTTALMNRSRHRPPGGCRIPRLCRDGLRAMPGHR